MAGAEQVREYGRRPESVKEARDFCRKALDNFPYCHDAAYVVSELCSNAVLHAEGEYYTLIIGISADHCRIEVIDQGSNKYPKLVDASSDAGGGRGLKAVAALASDYGFAFTSTGTTVWAELRPSLMTSRI